MSVRKELQNTKARSIDIDELINRGAKVKEDDELQQKEWKIFNIRIPASLLKELDQIVTKKIGRSRVSIVLEAIQDMIKKERDS